MGLETLCSSILLIYLIFTQENILLLGGELDEVIVYDIKNEKQLQTFKAHDIRFATFNILWCTRIGLLTQETYR